MKKDLLICLWFALTCPSVIGLHSSGVRDFSNLLAFRLPSDPHQLQGFLDTAASCDVEAATTNRSDYGGSRDWSRCDPSGLTCLDVRSECLNYSSYLHIYKASPSDATALSPYLLYQILSRNCFANDATEVVTAPISEAWPYGLASIGVMTGVGVLMTPLVWLLQRQSGKPILAFLLAMVVGSLAGGAFINHLPQAFDVSEDTSYVWRGCACIFGVYMFYMLERVVDLWLNTNVDMLGNPHVPPPAFEHPPADEDDCDESAIPLKDMASCHRPSHTRKRAHKCLRSCMTLAPIAWMIIFSHAIQSFIHGMSIGRGFILSTTIGLKTSLAILLSEILHKPGDLAVLVKAGVSFKTILLFSVLVGFGYAAGLAAGITRSLEATVERWLSAFCGGLFLYIGLAIMIPEMNDIMAESAKAAPRSAKIKLLLIQNTGLMTGIFIIALSARFGYDVIPQYPA